MKNTRDAHQGAGVESGLSMKQKISEADGLGAMGKPKPENVGGAWPKSKVHSMSGGHKFKNG